MNEIGTSLQELITQFRDADVSASEVTDLLREISDGCRHVCMIRDLDTNLICHINKPAELFFGLNGKEVDEIGFSFCQKLVHPDFLQTKPLTLSFFSNPENFHKVYEYMYYVTTSDGWKWVYSCSQIACFHEDGRPRFLLTVIAGIDDILINNVSEERLISEIDGFNNIDYERFNSLTKRELEILRLVCKEYTTTEIASSLFIGKSTIDSHRKAMLKKLNVKSAIGLAKYIYLFEPDNA